MNIFISSKNQHKLINTLKLAESTNEYDYNKMIEDFELEQRNLKTMQNNKNKWEKENKKYLEKVEQMKEKKEENYLTRRNRLLTEFDKKQNQIEKQLFKIKESREGESKKHIKMMRRKEYLAQIRKKRKEEKEENNRLKYETQIFTKCNLYIYI